MEQELSARFLALRKQYIEGQFGKLNDVQREAVFHTEGPLLILAGAGSGKTTVLVNRIANLVRFGGAYHSSSVPAGLTGAHVAELEQLVQTGGAPSQALAPLLAQQPVWPYRILAITFTNKAAGELKNRLSAMLGQAGQDVNASTFHSACVRILRRDGEHVGIPKSFTIYDTDDAQRAMKEVYRALEVDDKFLPVKTALNAIGRLKDRMVSPDMAAQSAASTRDNLVAKVYSAYEARLQSAGALDFDGLIYQTVRLLSEHADVREDYQRRFRYVLVDEYQDTSVAQFELVRLLTGPEQNVCVVGDDDQSIYRFRGATIENILNFEQHFRGARVIRLEQNYRSTSNILNAANCVIRNNAARKGKTLWTDNGDGAKIACYEADSELDEAAHVAEVIGRNVKNGAKLRDHAILYRMNAQSGPVETYFARAGIPYKIVGGHRFYDRKEIKDILAYMSIVANKNDDLRLRRIINEPARKIGATTVQNVADMAAADGVAMLENAGEEGQTRLEHIGQLVSSVKTYADQRGPEASLEGFLEEVALISDLDSYDEDADVVVMMTLHSAKGLEFPYVFVLGLEEGIFPSEMSRFSQEDLEEERRLCYVGITRAKKELYLSCAASRMMFGQTKRNKPSRFLMEIGPELLEYEQSPMAAARAAMRAVQPAGYGAGYAAGGYGAGAVRGNYLNREYNAPMRPAGRAGGVQRHVGGGSTLGGQAAPARAAGGFGAGSGIQAGSAARPAQAAGAVYKPGDIVEHKVFGRGQVLKTTPVAGDTIVEIRFEKAGVKKTMANYAPLKKVQG